MSPGSGPADRATGGAGRGAGAGRPAGAARGEAPADPRPPSGGRAAALHFGLLVLGLLTGAAGVLVQGAWFPGGLLLALAAAAGLFWGGAKCTRSKPGAMTPAAGWLLAVLLSTTGRAEGDLLFGVGTGSYVYLFGGMLIAVMCATIALPAPPVPGNKYR